MTQSEAAFDDEVEKAIRIRSCALLGRAGFAVQDLDDIRQEMRAELLIALPRFDPGRARRSTFIARVLERKANHLVRYRMAEKRDYRRESFSLNAVVTDGDGRRIARAQLIGESDHARLLGQRCPTAEYRRHLQRTVARAVSSLPNEQRMLCQRIRRVGLRRVLGRRLTQSRAIAEQVRQIRRCLAEAGVGICGEEAE